jgi:SAM-dependent methyltransferase
MRVLDLGCNAGLYSIESALMGAYEVIGIEMRDVWFDQAVFVRRYFEQKHGSRLNVRYIKKKITPELLGVLGKFDVVYAISILYHFSGKQGKEIAKALSKMTGNIIARYRTSYPSYKGSERDFTRHFKGYGFRVRKRYPQAPSDRFFVQYVRGDGQ